MTAALSSWSASTAGGEFCAPSAMVLAGVAGTVTGHPTIPDGRAVRIAVSSSTPTSVTDPAGVVYTLGTPDPLYTDWCARFQCMIPSTSEGLRSGQAFAEAAAASTAARGLLPALPGLPDLFMGGDGQWADPRIQDAFWADEQDDDDSDTPFFCKE